jgi:hypothetical protein
MHCGSRRTAGIDRPNLPCVTPITYAPLYACGMRLLIIIVIIVFLVVVVLGFLRRR